jgi:hypothetical protein
LRRQGGRRGPRRRRCGMSSSRTRRTPAGLGPCYRHVTMRAAEFARGGLMRSRTRAFAWAWPRPATRHRLRMARRSKTRRSRPRACMRAQHGRVRWGFAAGLSTFGGGARPHAEAAPRGLSSTGHAVRMRKGGLDLACWRKIARRRARRAAPSHRCHAMPSTTPCKSPRARVRRIGGECRFVRFLRVRRAALC